MSEWLDLMMEEVERKRQELDAALAETKRRETSGKAVLNDDTTKDEKTGDDRSADDNQAA